MSQAKNFHLPDLGEGLPDATIVEWFVKEGDSVRLDDPLVSMETAKAVVEVPSPFSGTVTKLAGAAGDIIVTGAVLAQFALDASQPQRADGQDTGHSHGPAPTHTPSTSDSAAGNTARVVASDNGGEIADADSTSNGESDRDDAGTVVGAMQSSNAVQSEQAIAVGGVRAMPAVRALARKLRVELAQVRATGPDGTVTMADVKQAAAAGSAPVSATRATASVTPINGNNANAGAQHAAANTQAANASASDTQQRSALSASGKPMRTQSPSVVAKGQPEQLKGVRRNMARVMADAHSKVVPTTLNDDADIHAWQPGNDVTVRLVRGIVRACQAVPALNAWFDGEALSRTLHTQVDIGIAVDTEEGLFVPALRNADMLDAHGIRESVNRLRQQVENRSIAASELSGYTISLSNFGMFAGRYATPVVVPPCVAIVAAGRARYQLTPVMGSVETHKVMPLSLTFDHRAATGGEAARFLRALLDDLALAN
ncbi:dihydrolipoamide acetyltransferase family protein [Xanthomonas hortorum pv. vitians]|uniref:Dihydrolipoamide acetyltransferase component of pyruvate dehydrogenase complex n=1 Tax=Xanthomonas hortorum pv. vitians TaxID=83224 RepID=A0A6V7BIT1_9XANT|nr:dihydrolipoamide acetyltransferase family protein [Xanthomonas hortorum]APP86367.1 branched-chain alpha-keto acid dehydrogenase subunit E2 [Xanthomonas hortorum pv. gardneri]ASW47622.1 branched-chain alpha-keto acid dehydrogenase subunit E2 [Xanthomonas hortorum]MCC8493462.1 2-oxo acid dehydrogenase subunit E2 [Xanthomonas hortorum pv. gardneri]MCE4281510.1 2-oxo acid dehydrogenase subunit E2 [Xanthomonas hortorum pv. vitians]MCE4286255.1 2-oxo acid dehydrogenase subunit E2 [Xanthomonas hor